MGFPADLVTIILTGTYTTITGTPLSGQVNFSVTTPLTDATGKVILGVGTQSVTLNQGGEFSIVLPCTDNADFNPTNFTYLVTEVIPGLGRAYYIALPHTLGTTVDISAVAPAATPPAPSAFFTANTWSATQTFSGTPGVKITTGAVNGDVLTSDAAGNATWQPPSGGFVNPMTTLGDTLYENATPAAARLPGNTTTARNFLTQTGTGTISAVPAWGTLTPADFSQAFPWQFYPDNPVYGAKGDGKVIADATVGVGNLSQLTSASAAFTSADTGKHIMLNGGQGNNAQPLITTITFVNSTTVTLASPASGAVTNASAIYGTDDTAAIQAAVTAAGNYALAAGGPYHAQVIFGAKIYCLTTPPPVLSGIAGSTTSQIRIPSPASNTVQKLILELLGTGTADANMWFDATIPDIRATALVSMCIPPFTSGVNPYPSIVGYQYANNGTLTGGFANTKVYVDGITAVIPYLGPQGAWDFRFLGGAGGGRFSAMAFGPPANGTYNNLNNLNNLAGQQGGSSAGLYMPLTGNNDDCTIVSFVNQGFTFGAYITEHCAIHRFSSVYDIVGLACLGGGAHGNWIGYASIEQVFAAVQFTGTSAFPLIIDYLDTEQVSTWHVQDTQNALYGSVLVHTNSTFAPAVLGGTNMKIFWDHLGPGHWSGAPAVPLSTSAQQNTAWRDAFLVVHAGAGVTVSAIAIDAIATGLTVSANTSTALPVVPAGHSVTLTYSGGTPTWDWWLT